MLRLLISYWWKSINNTIFAVNTIVLLKLFFYRGIEISFDTA